MIKKLRLRFVLVNMSIVTLLLVVMMSLVYRYNTASLESQNISSMRRVAALVANARGDLRELPDDPMMACFVVETGEDGRLLAWGSDYYDLSDKQELGAMLAAAAATQEETAVLENWQLRFYRISDGRYLFSDVSGKQTILQNLRNSCILVGIAWLLAFFPVCLVLAMWASRPVQKAWDQQRQFVADASHELKNPLAIIMANAELLQGETSDPACIQRFSGHILATSYHMRSLVERLLETARVDSARPELTVLDLSQLTRDAALSVQLLFEEQGRPLESRIQDGIRIRGNESQLYQLLDVLLDNALKYSRGEGAVEVALQTAGRYCTLSVSSPGPELTAQQRRDIFKRFYRVDSARSLDGSYGLGLSIAQRITELHRGRIRAIAARGTNTFEVLLPVHSFHPNPEP